MLNFINDFRDKMWFVRLFLDIHFKTVNVVINWLDIYFCEMSFLLVFDDTMERLVRYSIFSSFVFFSKCDRWQRRLHFRVYADFADKTMLHFVISLSTLLSLSLSLIRFKSQSNIYILYMVFYFDGRMACVCVSAITWHIYWLYFLDSSILTSTSRCRM